MPRVKLSEVARLKNTIVVKHDLPMPSYYTEQVRAEALKHCRAGLTPKAGLIAAGLKSAMVDKAYRNRHDDEAASNMFDELYSATMTRLAKLAADTMAYLDDAAEGQDQDKKAKARLEFRDRLIKDLIAEGWQEQKNEAVIGDITITVNRVAEDKLEDEQ